MKNITDFSQKLKRDQKGFTLIELLVVIGILAVLLAIVLVAINPAQQFQQANDTQRKSDVNAILNATHQYMVDNNGQLPPGITTTAQNVSNTGADLCADLVPKYIADLPLDPSTGTVDPEGNCTGATTYDTGYTIIESADGRVTVEANPEGNDDISVTR